MSLGLSHKEEQKSQPYRGQLPCSTTSLCPECRQRIEGQLYEKDGQVFLSKTCRLHGTFNELISSDAEFFKKLRRTHYEQPSGVDNPHCENKSGCPYSCGLCEQHLSTPAMVNVDLTNRCNLNCPICFANSNATGRVCEYTLEQLDVVLEKARNIRPHPASCLQYAGGEPTIYKHFVEAVRRAKRHGFGQIQVATNGLRFAQSPEFAQAASDAGLDQVYLQFDGLSDDIYEQCRGRALLDIKYRAIENIKKANIRVVLVPTLVKGLNDHQVGDITRFAMDNIDAVSAISWQPVAITGRIDESKRRQMRYTTADLARGLQEQTGFLDMYRDWYPFSIVMPFVRLLEATTNQPHMRVSCHPHCGCATYMVVDKQKKTALPLPAFIDIEPAMETLNKIATRIEKHSWTKKLSVLQAMNSLKKHFHSDRAPQGWGFDDFREFVKGLIYFDAEHSDKASYMQKLQSQRFGTLLMASMHFQDSYNYELDRVRHCVILYAGQDGRFYPFCTWNSGPCHRYKVEKAFSRPVNAQRRVQAVSKSTGAGAKSEAGVLK